MYDLKSYVLNSGLYNLYLDFRKYIYKTYGYLSNKEIEIRLTCTDKTIGGFVDIDLRFFKVLFNDGDLTYYKECSKIYKARKQQQRRLNKRVEKLLKKPCLFLTLTFTDNVLKSTTEKQRRTKITRYLKQFGADYVGNKDYGKKNHREHYHCILQKDKIDYSTYLLGSINGRKCVEGSSLKLSHYISKLTNHCLKETAERSSLIYSR